MNEIAAPTPEPTPPAEDPEQKLKEELARIEAERGADHEDLAGPLTELSIHLIREGRVAEAEQLARRLLRVREATDGPGGPRAVAVKGFLMYLLKLQRRYNEAARLLRELLAHQRESDGPRSPHVARLYGELASLREAQGRIEEARGLYQRALRMLRRTSATPDAASVGLIFHVASFHGKRGTPFRALRLYRLAHRHYQALPEAAPELARGIAAGLELALSLCAGEHMREQEWDEALVLARELAALVPSQGHRLVAEIYEEAGQVDDAIDALRAALRELPDDGGLWSYLGDLYSRKGRYKDAQATYERALRCQGVNGAVLHYHAGMACHQQGRLMEALVHLGKVDRAELPEAKVDLYWNAAAMRMALFKYLERPEPCLELAQAVLDELCQPGLAQEESAASLVCLGRALLYLRGDRAAARACAVQAYRLDESPLSLGLQREICGRASPQARCLRITIKGQRRDPETGTEFPCQRTYAVVADTTEEGLSFIQPFEEPDLAGPLQLKESTDLGTAPDGFKGIYAIGDLLIPR
jgi:tetratricopeptide (TPR) repeat protein